jgi:hypothetical protein
VSLGPAALQDHGLALDVAQLAERVQKRILWAPIRRRGRKPDGEQTDARHFPHGRRVGGERRHEESEREGDEEPDGAACHGSLRHPGMCLGILGATCPRRKLNFAEEHVPIRGHDPWTRQYRLDPDRAAPVCGADLALVTCSPSPAPLPRYPSAPWPTAHARDPELIHHRRRGEARACDSRDKPARKAWCLWCTTSGLACTPHRGQGATPPTASRQGGRRTRGPVPTTPSVSAVRSLS